MLHILSPLIVGLTVCFWHTHSKTVPAFDVSLDNLIIGGKPAKLYPFYVFVHLDVLVTKFYCGGSIIAPNAVVTAAHCFYYERGARWMHTSEVSIFDADFTKSNWRYKYKQNSCERYSVHPKFGGRFPGNDIAVIVLKENMDLSKRDNAVLQPCPAGQNYQYGTAIGMGLISQHPREPASVLMEAELQGFPKCGGWYGHVDTRKQICFSVPGTADSCFGDSGGPLVYKEGNQVKCLIGITSFGASNCLNKNFPGVYTRAGFHKDWIEKQL